VERITLSLLTVLAQFVDNPREELFGYRLARATSLPSGRVHENLIRLEQAGWIEARWEEEATRESHRGPRRRLYRLTALGLREGPRLLEQRTRGLRRDIQGRLRLGPETQA
jgi:PadR family transcriptional regulator, regulatory protein PadR